MATGAQVLSMLLPDGGWTMVGDSFEGITFLEATPITKKQFEDGFAQYDAWKESQETAKQAEKEAILNRLGLTAEEAKLILS